MEKAVIGESGDLIVSDGVTTRTIQASQIAAHRLDPEIEAALSVAQRAALDDAAAAENPKG